MPDLSREEREGLRAMAMLHGMVYSPLVSDLLDALDAAEQRPTLAQYEQVKRDWRAAEQRAAELRKDLRETLERHDALAQSFLDAEQRAEKAERDLALEMDARGRWAARAEDAEADAERLYQLMNQLMRLAPPRSVALRPLADAAWSALAQHERERA